MASRPILPSVLGRKNHITVARTLCDGRPQSPKTDPRGRSPAPKLARKTRSAEIMSRCIWNTEDAGLWAIIPECWRERQLSGHDHGTKPTADTGAVPWRGTSFTYSENKQCRKVNRHRADPSDSWYRTWHQASRSDTGHFFRKRANKLVSEQTSTKLPQGRPTHCLWGSRTLCPLQAAC